ncbi:ornithine carbamoyltransferase [Sulfodiicoccus acidiphilus]|uniref:Ornithine carbamoyltransferase n=1 Tax=Sulfodiicoccus acidiphilus TaxID=1670455 RepID=A0A830H3M9_9CREN|nr:ornithine carbamoyltransferase [Sulfodiicoccus acidiphilus]
MLSVFDLSRGELESLLEATTFMKNLYLAGGAPQTLQGKRVAILLEKPSTRTRVSFESAVAALGGHPIVFTGMDLQLSRGEPVEDTGRVLGKYVHGIGARVLRHETLIKLSRSSGVPVLNLLSDAEHPLQALSDLFTMKEHFGRIPKIAFVGDGGDNVLASLMGAVAKLGLELNVASPKELKPSEDVLRKVEEESELTDATVEFFEDPYQAVRGVKVVYTDVWVSMGKESEADRRRSILRPYAVTNDLMSYASSDAVFMHCLPAVRGEEVESSVIDGPRSLVWTQAENKFFGAMAALVFTL